MKRALRVLISAGPTREPIDPVRYLSNYSTGYMGVQLAAEALRRGDRVTVISGPGVEPLPSGARIVAVERAEDMERAMRQHAGRAHVVIMAAAVSDFRPVKPAAAKLPRRRRFTLELEATPDIIRRLPRRRGQVVVGFALETEEVVPRARRKLSTKRLDLLLAQRVDSRGSPFGRRKVQAWLLSKDGAVARLGTITKLQAARALLDKAETLWYGRVTPHQGSRGRQDVARENPRRRLLSRAT